MDPGASADEILIERSDDEFRRSYAIGQSIGAGGAGEVFLATQVSLQRQVVVKVMQRALVADETHRRRFHREARMLSRLSHSRITQVYEYGVWEGQPYLVMEHVDGGSLASLMERQPRVMTNEALKIAMQTAEGLDFLHQKRILHRDIKPGNILLTAQRDAKIADFGLARPDGESGLTAQGMVVGTLWYIAPEVLVSEDASPQSDLFSLGMVLYQMLAGRMPFREDVSDVVQLASMRVNEPPLGLQVHRPDLPAEITGLVNRLLSSEPKARHAHAGELAEELAELHDGVASPSRRMKRIAQVSGASRAKSSRHPSMRTENISVTQKVVESDSAPTVLRGVAAASRLALHTLPASRMRRWLVIGLLVLIPAGLVAGLVAWRNRAKPVIEVDPDVPGHGAPLSITRSPRWVKARMVTVMPAKLVVRATAVGDMTGQPIEVESKDLHEHEVEVEPLMPRVTYQIESRLVLPDKTVQRLGSTIAESPLESLKGLARDIGKLKVLEALEKLDKERPGKHAPAVRDVMGLLQPAKFQARADALAPFVDEIYADESLSVDDRWRIYKGLEELRFLDRYCEAHLLGGATGVERLLPPDLRWGPRSLADPEPVRGRALAGMVEGQIAEPIEAFDPASTFLLEIGDLAELRGRMRSERIPKKIQKTFAVPVLKARKAQLKLVARNVRSAVFSVSVSTLKEPIRFVAPYAKGLTGESVTMYHWIPAAWVKPGPWNVTISATVAPGPFRNARPLNIAPKVDALTNFPQFEEIALLATE